MPNEEEKVERETAKIFGKWINGCFKPANIVVNASCCRVPVLDGHLETVTVELDREIDIDILKDYRKQIFVISKSSKDADQKELEEFLKRFNVESMVTVRSLNSA